MAFLGSLLRQGTEFGLGALQGRDQREKEEAEAAKQAERDAMEMAIQNFNLDSARRQQSDQAMANSQQAFQSGHQRSLRQEVLGEDDSLSDPTRELLAGGGPAFDAVLKNRLNPPTPDAPSQGAIEYNARVQQLMSTGMGETQARAVASDPSASRDLISPPAQDAGDPVGQRGRVLNANRDLSDLEQAVAENRADNLQTKFTEEEIQSMIDSILRRYAFSSVEELAEAARAFGGEQPAGGDEDPLGLFGGN